MRAVSTYLDADEELDLASFIDAYEAATAAVKG